MVDGVAPDVRDGLTPASRRALAELALVQAHTPLHVTSARTVDAVLAKGRVDGGRRAIYRELVRMASDWEMRHPLVDGQGDLGSLDGDGPVSADYTEMRLGPLGSALLTSAEFPNLLVNGSFSVATGAASRVPPHNLREVVDATVAYIDDPRIDVGGLLAHIRGPDFPTGAIVAGDGAADAYASGRGTLAVRARAAIEPGPAPAIVISELPFMVSKGGRGGVLADIRRAARAKRVRGIAAVDDQSGEPAGLRIVIELARGSDPDAVLEQLYAHTRLQARVELDFVATVESQARRLGLRDLVKHYVEHRRDVVARRTGLRSEDRILDIVKSDLLELAALHGDERRTEIR